MSVPEPKAAFGRAPCHALYEASHTSPTFSNDRTIYSYGRWAGADTLSVSANVVALSKRHTVRLPQSCVGLFH